MARVTIFVDDAVRGDLPPVCAKTGEPADTLTVLNQTVGAPAWWLLLLGPIGFVLFLFYAHRSEVLTVHVPTSPEVRAYWKRLRDMRLVAIAVSVAALAVWILGAFQVVWLVVPLLAVGGVACIVIGVVEFGSRIGVDLDASRRWVTFTGVHDDFVAAVRTSTTRVS